MANGREDGRIEKERLSDLVTCAICIGFYREPKILPCTHSFCLECLQQYINKALSKGYFPCPICRHDIELPGDGARSFRTNYFINRLQDELNIVPESRTCDICLTAVAKSKCTECCQYLCEECSRNHSDNTLSRDHHVISIEVESTQADHVSGVTLRCSEHKSELVRYFCLPCQKLICSDCKALKHTGHKATTFRDAANDKRDMLREELANLSSNALRLVSRRRRVSKAVKYLKTERNKTRLDIDKVKDQLLQRITTAAEIAKEKLETFYTDVLKTKDSELESLNVQAAQLENHREYTEILMHKASDLEVLDSIDLVKNRSSTLFSQKTQTGISQVLKLDQKGLNALGEHIDQQFMLGETEVDTVIVREEGKIESPVKGWGVTGICLTDDKLCVCQEGRVFERDTNTWKDISDAYQIYGRAYDVCMSKGDIVVSSNDRNGYAQLMFSSPSLKLPKSIMLPFKSYNPSVVFGPLVGGQSTYLITEDHFSEESVIQQIDSMGNTLQTYGKGELRNPVGLAADEQGHGVVTDGYLDEVIVFHCDGSITCRLREHNNLSKQQLSRPKGVCVDQDGFIFVSSCYTPGVLLFSPAGDYIQTLVTTKNRLEWPTKLSTSSDGRLAVATAGDVIYIYEYTVLL